MVFITCQLQANASDLNRDLVVGRHLRCALQMLIGAGLVTTLLSCFSSQQIVHDGLFGVIGVFGHQLFHLLIIALGELNQRLLGLLTGATALAANEPATGMGTGAENTAQDPLQRQQHHNAQDQNDHQTRYAGFDVVIVGLDQHVSLVTGKHRPKDDPGDQQDKE